MDAPTKPGQPDAYADLEVIPAATNAEIKAAFHRLALFRHPDKTAPGEAFDAADFRRVYAAYGLLRDQKGKEDYDKCYSSTYQRWDVYKREHAEYAQDPTTWRRRKVEADRQAAEQRRQAQAPSQTQYEYYDDTGSDDEYGYQYYYRFGGLGHGSRPLEPNEWDLEEILLAELLRRRENLIAAARRSAEERARKAVVEDINKRCIERLKKAAETQQAKDNGIRIADPERKRAMAQSWFINLQRDYNQELQNAGLRHSSDSVMDLGWEKKKGRQVCLFCDARVQEYSYRCPSGGAVACRSCKKEIESSSVNKPFNFANTESSTRKGKSKKAKSGNKSRKAKTRAEIESDLEKSGSAEQEQDDKQDRGEEAEHSLNEEEEAAKQAAEKIARKQEAERQKQERKAEEARRRAEREAQTKLAQGAAEKAAQEKAEAKQAARDWAAAQEAARQAAKRKKEARKQEAREKKAARKKAAKERAALEKAAQRKAAEERGAAQREAQDRGSLEQEIQKTCEDAEQGAKYKSTTEVKAKTELDASERAARQAEERKTIEAKQRTGLEAKETIECEARKMVERVTEETVECLKRGAAERNGKEAAAQQVQDSTSTNDAEGHKAENEMTGDGEQQVLEPHSATTQPAEPSISNSTAVPEKVKKKATRPPPICYVCREEGHVARNCPTKPVRATEAIVSEPPTTPEPAVKIEVTNKPPPPAATAPAKIVVKLPAPHKQKIREAAKGLAATSQESAIDSTNAPASQPPAKPGRTLKKTSRPAPQKVPRTNDSAAPVPSSISPAPANGTADVFVSIQTSKPMKKLKVKGTLTCYVCKEAGHKAKNCPTNTEELMFATVR
ncbi:hypothetical protein G6011_06340 [Alternaria panax]|uniref:J domain-containing protein n=1 Tax=Alternaria panax TaxID=48097 RepID=A0AAD4FG72_9PLEO|nr:hypothetical protein G6011_06340 [Alternaria panax]